MALMKPIAILLLLTLPASATKGRDVATTAAAVTTFAVNVKTLARGVKWTDGGKGFGSGREIQLEGAPVMPYLVKVYFRDGRCRGIVVATELEALRQKDEWWRQSGAVSASYEQAPGMPIGPCEIPAYGAAVTG